jgi:glutamate 5-kinase
MQFLQANARRLVIKIGTNSLAHEDGSLQQERINELCRQIAALRQLGFQCSLVSSGAVGLGMGTLGLKERPENLACLQACAALGQPSLIRAWQTALQAEGIPAAQVLLTREDVRGRGRHLAVRDTLNQLLELDVVPIINENDTVSADEIKFGDNDVLSALVSSLLKADLLIILSTIPGLLTEKGKGHLIPLVESIDAEVEAMAGTALNSRSTGGMLTKLEAARIATRSGCGMFIGAAAQKDILLRIATGDAEGTFFVAQKLSLAARKRWIAWFAAPGGSLTLDQGAVQAVTEKKASLLAKGVTACEGEFPAGSVVTLVDPQARAIARGVSAFSSSDLRPLLGFSSEEIQRHFPERRRLELVHRDTLVLY